MTTACATQGNTYADEIAKKSEGRTFPKNRLDTIRISPADLGDTSTTAIGLWTGVAVEAKPVLATLGSGLPVVLPASNSVGKGLEALGVPWDGGTLCGVIYAKVESDKEETGRNILGMPLDETPEG